MANSDLTLVIKAINKASPVFNKIKKDLDSFSKKTATATKKAGASFKKFEKSLDSTRKKLKKVGETGKKAFAKITIPLTALGVASFISFAKLDEAMTKSLAIMGNVSDEMRGDMKKLAETLSSEVAISADKLADSYFFLASAGLDAAQSMAALPAVANFATAGAFDMAKATDLLTDAQSALGLTVQDATKNLENMTRLSDIFVKANTLANASVEQFSEALTNEAGVAMKQYGIELEDGIATLAAFADQGIKGNVAGSLLARGIRLLTKAALENEDEFKKMGIAVFDAEGNFRSMDKIAADLENAFEGLSTEQRASALETLGFAARTQQAILPLIGMSDQIKTYATELEKAGGTTKEVAEKQLKSFSNQMKNAWNATKVLAAGIAEQLAPIVSKIAEKIKNLAIRFNDLSDRTKKVIGIVIALVAIISPLLIAIGSIGVALSGLIPIIAAVITALAFLGLTPIGGIIAGIALLTGAILLLGDSSEKEMKRMSNAVAAAEKRITKSVEKNVGDHKRLAKNIFKIEQEIVEAKKLGMNEVVSAKSVELKTLLELEKRGAQDRLRVLDEELNAVMLQRGAIFGEIEKLEGQLAASPLDFRTEKRLEGLRGEFKKTAKQANSVKSAIQAINEIGKEVKISVETGGFTFPELEKFSEATEKIKDDSKAVDKWTKKYKELGSVIEKELSDLAIDHEKASSKIRDKIENIKSSLIDLREEYAKGMGGLDVSIGEEVIKQEEKIAEIREKLNSGLKDVSEFSERKTLVEQLKKEEAALREFQKNSEGLEDEIADARRKSRLTDFERFLEDSEKKRQTLTEDFEDKKAKFQAELDIQNANLEAERAIYETKRTELKKVQDTHAEMVKSVETGNNSMVANTRTTAEALEIAYNKIKASLDKIRAITAPAGIVDKRTDDQVFAQTGAPSPINTSNPFQPSRAGAAASQGGGGQPITNNVIIKDNNIDSEERVTNLIDRIKSSLGRDIKVTSLGA